MKTRQIFAGEIRVSSFFRSDEVDRAVEEYSDDAGETQCLKDMSNRPGNHDRVQD